MKGVNCFEVDSFDVWSKNCMNYLGTIALGKKRKINIPDEHRIWEVEGSVLWKGDGYNEGQKVAIICATYSIDRTNDILPFLTI